jgi:glutamyl-tRNA synthetase
MMLEGGYRKGDAVVRVKTDLSHPNPAVRDWPALRISERPHPLQGTRYRVWPLYNFSCGLDDHLMGVSHVIRGKEHDVNAVRQQWLHRHFGWRSPEVVNVGRLGLEVGILSKSKMRRGIEDGTYSGWDDPRLGTLRALRRRGLQPEAIRAIMIQVGPKPVNVTISWDNIAAENRRLVEPLANRYFFVADPVEMRVTGIPGPHTARLPLHPDHPERGTRDHEITPTGGEYSFAVPRADAEKLSPGGMVRLMGAMNAVVGSTSRDLIQASYNGRDHQAAREAQAPFIHWLPRRGGAPGRVVMPDASEATGLVEEACLKLKPDQMIQFERFGYCRVDQPEPFTAYYTHK